jgi:predicted DNA-binding ribbon-helix-helix protein
MSGGLKKRSLNLAGHATSVALEPAFWAVLEQMAEARGVVLTRLILEIDAERRDQLLASALRVAALDWARQQPPETDQV